MFSTLGRVEIHEKDYFNGLCAVFLIPKSMLGQLLNSGEKQHVNRTDLRDPKLKSTLVNSAWDEIFYVKASLNMLVSIKKPIPGKAN